MKTFLTAATFAVAATVASSANATLLLTTGINGGNTGTENVLFNVAGLSDNSTLVQGILNQSGEIVDFTSTQTLTTPSGGQARIEKLGGGTFNNVSIGLDDQTLGFGKLIFDIHAPTSGTAHITATDQFGTLFDFGNQSITGNGQNFFTMFSNDDQVAIALTINTTVGMTSIDQLEQVRLGATNRTPTGVPEPATLAILGSGLLGLAGIVRRRRSA